MRALMKLGPGFNKMKLVDIPIPKADNDQVLIRVVYTGICGTDLHTFKGEYDRLKLPLVLGHEFSGIVEEIGSNVNKVKQGDYVTSETTFESCDKCEYCKNNELNLCLNRKGIGSHVNGSFAEFVLCRQDRVHLLSEKISLLEASIVEPIACGVHASMEKVQVHEGDIALINGPGPIGLCLSQILKSQGATVILMGITRNRAKLKLALDLGVNHIIDTQTENAAKKIKEITNGKGVDYCFECSGAVISLTGILGYLKKKGALIQIGIFPGNENLLDLNTLLQKEIRIIGSRSQKPSSWYIALDLLEQKKINAERIITKVFPLEEWDKAFSSALSGKEIKVVLQPNKI